VDYGYGITVTVRRPGGTDRNGDPLPTTEHTIDDCAVAPRTSSEANTYGNAVVVGLELFVPYGADIAATDTVLLPGDATSWYVDGAPGQWRSPFTDWRPGTQVALTRQKG
jgi:hypothetical protein